MILTLFEQSGFTLESAGKKLAIDVGRFTSTESLQAIGKPDYSLVSHMHGDHFYEENLTSLAASIITVAEVASLITDTNLIVTTITEGETITLPETLFTITATASNHGTGISAPVENIGFLISAEGKAVYFLGDMAISTPPPTQTFNIALVPVGNHGYVFTPEQAAEHIQSIGFTGLVIPIHYTNGDPESGKIFADLIKATNPVQALEIGQSIQL